MEKVERVVCLDTLWVENFDRIALSDMVKEIQAGLCFTCVLLHSYYYYYLREVFSFLTFLHSTVSYKHLSKVFQQTWPVEGTILQGSIRHLWNVTHC